MAYFISFIPRWSSTACAGAPLDLELHVALARHDAVAPSPSHASVVDVLGRPVVLASQSVSLLIFQGTFHQSHVVCHLIQF